MSWAQAFDTVTNIPFLFFLSPRAGFIAFLSRAWYDKNGFGAQPHESAERSAYAYYSKYREKIYNCLRNMEDTGRGATDMELKLPVGISDFEKIRKDGFYYIDKTALIAEFLHTQPAEITLITRPRRFGKTLGMSMLAHFFDIRKDSRQEQKRTARWESI